MDLNKLDLSKNFTKEFGDYLDSIDWKSDLYSKKLSRSVIMAGIVGAVEANEEFYALAEPDRLRVSFIILKADAWELVKKIRDKKGKEDLDKKSISYGTLIEEERDYYSILEDIQKYYSNYLANFILENKIEKMIPLPEDDLINYKNFFLIEKDNLFKYTVRGQKKNNYVEVAYFNSDKLVFLNLITEPSIKIKVLKYLIGLEKNYKTKREMFEILTKENTFITEKNIEYLKNLLMNSSDNNLREDILCKLSNDESQELHVSKRKKNKSVYIKYHEIYLDYVENFYDSKNVLHCLFTLELDQRDTEYSTRYKIKSDYAEVLNVLNKIADDSSHKNSLTVRKELERCNIREKKDKSLEVLFEEFKILKTYSAKQSALWALRDTIRWGDSIDTGVLKNFKKYLMTSEKSIKVLCSSLNIFKQIKCPFSTEELFLLFKKFDSPDLKKKIAWAYLFKRHFLEKLKEDNPEDTWILDQVLEKLPANSVDFIMD